MSNRERLQRGKESFSHRHPAIDVLNRKSLQDRNGEDFYIVSKVDKNFANFLSAIAQNELILGLGISTIDGFPNITFIRRRAEKKEENSLSFRLTADALENLIEKLEEQGSEVIHAWYFYTTDSFEDAVKQMLKPRRIRGKSGIAGIARAMGVDRMKYNGFIKFG